MIEFELTAEHKALQERARRFSKEVIQPAAAHHDRVLKCCRMPRRA